MPTNHTQVVAELLPVLMPKTRYHVVRTAILEEEKVYESQVRADCRWRDREAQKKAIRTAKGRHIRLNEYINGEVTISLAPGQLLEHSEGGACDEGYSRTDRDWYWDTSINCIIYREHNRSSDCDGPHEHHTECVLPIDQIPHACPRELPWEVASSGQRDYFAEAMGY